MRRFQESYIKIIDRYISLGFLRGFLLVLSILSRNRKPISSYKSLINKYPQKLVNIEVSKKPPIEELNLVSKAIKDAENDLGDAGRVLVRYSGTEMKIRVMVEAEDQNLCDQACEHVVKAVKEELL